ncbi:MAG: TetR/AcrR family transcriptional regulator [Proteobacteria bacterium]|nr:TetR/AcrR family transcriptional regulator [Pseudomonadota bacterium]
MSDSSERPYHHGNLKRVLIETALGMLQEAGGWQFTLREVARRAGVSHSAPYKHFTDKTALLTELSGQGYLQLRDELQDALTASETPPEQLRAVAETYIRFGLSNALLYRLMFSTEINKSTRSELNDASFSPFGLLTDVLARGQAVDVFRRAPPEEQATACWALLHGVTIFELDRPLAGENSKTQLADRALAILLEGLLV